MCTGIEAVGQEPDAAVEQGCKDVCKDEDGGRTRVSKPFCETHKPLWRKEQHTDEEHQQTEDILEDEIEEERQGDVVLVLPGIDEAEAPDIAEHHQNEEQRYAKGVVAKLGKVSITSGEVYVCDGHDVCLRHHQAEDEVQQVGTQDTGNVNDVHAKDNDHDMPEEALEVRGRQGQFVDAALLGEQVVEHVARRDDRIGTAYQGNCNAEAFHIIDNISCEEVLLGEHGIEVVQHDRRADEGYHEDCCTGIELAVDGEVPAGDVEETIKIKHIIRPSP